MDLVYRRRQPDGSWVEVAEQALLDAIRDYGFDWEHEKARLGPDGMTLHTPSGRFAVVVVSVQGGGLDCPTCGTKQFHERSALTGLHYCQVCGHHNPLV